MKRPSPSRLGRNRSADQWLSIATWPHGRMSKSATIGFKGTGDVIVRIGEVSGTLGQSLTLRGREGVRALARRVSPA